MFAVGGEVSIDTSPVPGDPGATLQKARRIRQAALAPADPSAQDMRVAARASQMALEARAELARARRAEVREGDGAQTGAGSGGGTVEDGGGRTGNGVSPEATSAREVVCPECGGSHGAGAHAAAAAFTANSAPPPGDARPGTRLSVFG